MCSNNKELIDYLKNKNKIKTSKVEKAFRNVDRKEFTQENRAYEDRPQPLLENSTISAPHMVAINTELLEIDQKNKVLELGSGSGYQLAILAQLSEEVIGVERIKTLVESSRQKLAKYDNVTIKHEDGLKHVEENFDRILYSFSIDQEEFERAKNLLKPEGILVAPVKKDKHQEILKYCSGSTESHGKVRFVPKKEGKE